VALSGLVFVGISINLTKLLASSHLPNRALEALVALIAVLFTSYLILIPGQPFLDMGIEVLFIGLIDWAVVLFLQLSSLRKMPPQYRREFARVIPVCQMAALCFVVAGIVLIITGTNGLYWLVAAMLLSFLAAFTDA
jgi:modulator of FtsH protease